MSNAKGRIFGLQHTGKGKYHLIPEDGEESKELCGSSGLFLFSYCDVELKDGLFYEYGLKNDKTLVPDWEIESCYCKKCIKKALNLNL